MYTLILFIVPILAFFMGMFIGKTIGSKQTRESSTGELIEALKNRVESMKSSDGNSLKYDSEDGKSTVEVTSVPMSFKKFMSLKARASEIGNDLIKDHVSGIPDDCPLTVNEMLESVNQQMKDENLDV